MLRPKLGDSRIGRWLAARLGDPCYRIRFDDIGTNHLEGVRRRDAAD